MTDDKVTPNLDAIAKRAAAATPGPWAARPCPPCTDRGRLDVVIWDPSENIPVATWADSDSYREEDARFIAHAREDVPALLNALAAERDRADRAETRLTPVRDEATPASTEKPPVSLTHRLMLDLIDMEDDAAVAKFARHVMPKMIDELTAYAADSDQLVEAWEEGYWAANDDWNEAPERDVATPNPYRSEATA